MNYKRKAFFQRISVCSIICCIVLLISATAFAAAHNSYQDGLEFGRLNSAAIQSNIDALKKMADEHTINMTTVMEQAYQDEELYNKIMPDKVQWMHGVAEGANLPYEKLLVLNSVDRNITGFQGECTTFMAQGSALKGSKGTIISKNRDQSAATLSEIGLQEKARHSSDEVYQAAYIDIPQVIETYKFVGSRTAGRWGYGMGINEFQVSVSDNDSTSRDILEFKKGLHDNDVVRLVLERAKTARERVDVVANLVEKYGQSWNGIMFEIGDPNELWIVEVTGHRWAAKRYVNTITARSNQYEIGDDYDLCSKDLVSFAVEQKWVKEGTQRINFRKVYGTLELYPESNDNFAKRPAVEKLYNTEMRYQRAMELLTKANGQIDAGILIPFTRDHYDTYKLPSGKVIDMHQVPFYSSDAVDWYNREWMPEWPKKDTIETSIYIRGICGHDLGWGATSSTGMMISRPDVPNELGVMLHSFMQPCNSTYIPFYVGMTKLDPRYSTPKAAYTFHNIAMRSFGYYKLYHDGIRLAFDPYEKQLLSDMPAFEQQYMELKKSGNDSEAQNAINNFVAEKCNSALKAADKALDNMEEAAIRNSQWQARQ
ncbi:C69 family dipeptidase [Sporomusa acidovorans]|uniref:Dipeptidase n=1 Tax=Sporomusa acidovorans (strain ATCC 49682 / DSM 3132 / Mol) TaxID=1123286 RepID=A0ABZ3J6Y9_SPOA4|nr:C69 family dipeptidase [Sporomusa acidovorans]OZC18562.1 dipeptidase [Sporomusa acidovorans DSM 3132]SDE38391.1 Dipeptidase [Sporomusa acidovorans]